MLTNEELDSLSIGGLGFCGPESFERLIAQAKEANKLREQLVTARRDALEGAAKVCIEIILETMSEVLYFGDGCAACEEAIRALKEKADSKLAQTTKDPIITQAQWDNACAGLGTKA